MEGSSLSLIGDYETQSEKVSEIDVVTERESGKIVAVSDDKMESNNKVNLFLKVRRHIGIQVKSKTFPNNSSINEIFLISY